MLKWSLQIYAKKNSIFFLKNVFSSLKKMLDRVKLQKKMTQINRYIMKKGIKQSEEYLRIVYFSNSLHFGSVLCVRVRAIFFHFRLKLKENNVLRQNLPKKEALNS